MFETNCPSYGWPPSRWSLPAASRRREPLPTGDLSSTMESSSEPSFQGAGGAPSIPLRRNVPLNPTNRNRRTQGNRLPPNGQLEQQADAQKAGRRAQGPGNGTTAEIGKLFRICQR